MYWWLTKEDVPHSQEEAVPQEEAEGMEEVEEKKTVIEPRGEELEEIGSMVPELDMMMGEGGQEIKKKGRGKKI